MYVEFVIVITRSKMRENQRETFCYIYLLQYKHIYLVFKPLFYVLVKSSLLTQEQ